MAEDKKIFKTAHNIIMESRRSLTVSGVMDIDRFDEESVIVFTELGELTITGKNLHMNKIDVDSGDLSMEGEIDSLSYSENRSQKGSFFSKLFR
ncbi:MAG: sporulation protein YabP [Oscillospiraceae bacterium]|jgi:sporulation protein YabP|nr:sporulation protein YabP [Oscillospiraceae bacterium]